MRRQSCLHILLQILILATLPLGAWAASGLYPTIIRYEPSVLPVTHEGRVRVTITKTKIHLARVQRPVAKLFLNDDDTDYYDELPELQVGYRRPELIDQSADVELSDSIKLRLALARYKALDKYNEVWGNGNIA